MYLTPLVLPALLATFACLAMVPVAWRRREAPGARAYAVLMGVVAHWAFLQVLGVAAADLETMLWLAKVQYLGVAFAPLATLAFTLGYTDRGHWLRGWRLPALALLPAATVVLAFTNEAHGLVWASVGLAADGPAPLLDLSYGPWFRAQVTYAYAITLFGASLLFWRLVQTPHHRRVLAGLLVSLGVVLGLNVAFLAGVRSMGGLDPTPTGFAVASVVLGWCLLRYRLFDLVPLAREAVFDGLEDPVIAIDALGRIRDLNVAARVLVTSDARAVGAPARRCLPAPLPAMLDHLGEGGRAEVALDASGETRIYDVVVTALGPRSTGRLLVMRDLTERKESELALLQAQEELRHANSELGRLANSDPLTGLTNRRQWIRALEREVARARRHGISLGVVMLDVDHFKAVNDRYGHLVGDQALVELARVLEGERRFHDVAARIGGEEFGLLVTHATKKGLAIVAERLRGHVEALELTGEDGEAVRITVSLGTAQLGPEGGDEPEGIALLRRADAALYRAKQAGRNRVEADGS